MPEISRFLGIVIQMFFRDHNPPHFHVRYGKYSATIDIEELKIIKGSLPARVHALVIEWAILHKKELLKDWEKSKNMQTPDKIKPLV
jgi:hypothetical protein